jgi:hypothetical protein
MRRLIREISQSFRLLLLVPILFVCNSGPTQDLSGQLREWRQGVWISGEGTYTIYTDSHYFVVSLEGDSTSPNIYCGSSQVIYHNRGIARHQVLRIRQMPGGDMSTFKRPVFRRERTEAPLVIDTTLFIPGTCTIHDGVIYDAVTEVTAEYILLSTCNGDQEKIFSDGVSAYLPAGGGEFYSHRVESF